MFSVPSQSGIPVTGYDNAYTFETLPAASSVGAGTWAFTTDQGPAYSDGTAWHAVTSSVTPGGTTGQVQYNNDGTLGGVGTVGPFKAGILYATDYGLSASSTDNGPALNTFFLACSAQNCTGIVPSGSFEVQTDLLITYNTTPASGQNQAGNNVKIIGTGTGQGIEAGTYIYWGAGSSSGPMLTINSLFNVEIDGIFFDGKGIAQDVVLAETTAGGYAANNWGFTNCYFSGPASGYAAFDIGLGNGQNTSQFLFTRCSFLAGSGAVGFRNSSNYNSVQHLFVSCNFGGLGGSNQAEYNFQMNAGSATLLSPQFSFAGTADIYYTGGTMLSIRDAFTQDSKQFLISPDTYNYSPLTIIGGTINSYPYSYWKAGYGSQPANTPAQFAAITYNHANSPLVMINTQFIDPSNGVWAVNMAGLGVQQQQSGVVAPYQWTNIGSLASTGSANAFTTTVFYDINNNPILNYNFGTQQLQSINYVANSGGRAVNTGTSSDTLAAGVATTYESANTSSGAFTVTIAAPTQDGERRRICFKNQTGTITWTPAAPATAVAGFPTTLAPGVIFEMVYNAASGTPANAPATTWLPY
jgi:hypothetical protein